MDLFGWEVGVYYPAGGGGRGGKEIRIRGSRECESSSKTLAPDIMNRMCRFGRFAVSK
jgi:hypothetical protein